LLPLLVKVTFVEQPAWLMLAIWLAVTVLLGALGLSTASGSATLLAIYAQLGGLAMGVLVALAVPGRVKARVPGGEVAA
jgi:membrane associated rhomboid family serine protease